MMFLQGTYILLMASSLLWWSQQQLSHLMNIILFLECAYSHCLHVSLQSLNISLGAISYAVTSNEQLLLIPADSAIMLYLYFEQQSIFMDAIRPQTHFSLTD